MTASKLTSGVGGAALLQVRGLVGGYNFATLSRFARAVRLQPLGGVHRHLPRVSEGDEGGCDGDACK